VIQAFNNAFFATGMHTTSIMLAYSLTISGRQGHQKRRKEKRRKEEQREDPENIEK